MLVPCKTCGGQIAKDAKTCPKCGTNLAKPKFSGAGIVLIVILLGFLGALAYGVYTSMRDHGQL